MNQDYDEATACHYLAFRPALHRSILELAFEKNECFSAALDVGCGAGHSTRALTRYCDTVVGIDPSAAMIAACEPVPGAKFLAQNLNEGSIDQSFGKISFDLFTFAGSLHYQDPKVVMEAIFRLAAPQGTSIVVYDFNVRLEPVFELLGRQPEPGSYDHAKNFDSAKKDRFQKERSLQATLHFSANPEEIAHLLLSVREWREGLLTDYGHAELVAIIAANSAPRSLLQADVWVTRYALR